MDESNAHKQTYRPDIDGLRAIAVLLVVFYHLDIPYLTGGFIGVDAFYVISGFVIFRIIFHQLENNNFSIWDFYKRRIRRIYPALGLTILGTMIVGYFLLTPNEYRLLGGDGLAANFSVSNFHFSDRLTYFAGAAKTIPLLHTWSLGVEEQFYILVPFLVLFLNAQKGWLNIFSGLLIVTLLSFLLQLFFLYGIASENKAFYLSISRFWELSIGGMLAYFEPKLMVTKQWSRLLAATGLVALIGSGFLINSSYNFPGYIIVLPVFSTALIIAANMQKDQLFNYGLTTKLMLFIGRISYSLYLFHWPIIVFTLLYLGREFTPIEKAAVLFISIALSYVSWRWIEAPFRTAIDKTQWQNAKRILSGMFVGITAISLIILFTNGFEGRLSSNAKNLEKQLSQESIQRNACTPILTDHTKKELACAYGDYSGKTDVILWGDSHAQMIAPQLSAQLKKKGKQLVLAYKANCPSLFGVLTTKRKHRDHCLAMQSYIQKTISENEGLVVILAGRWANLYSSIRAPGDGSGNLGLVDHVSGKPIEFDKALERTLLSLRKAASKVIILGPVPEVSFHVPNMLNRSLIIGRQMPSSPAPLFHERQMQVLNLFANLEQQALARVVYPHKSLCNAKECQTVEGQWPLYSDDDHLTFKGVERFLVELVNEASRP